MIDWSGYIGLILQGALVTIELTVMGSVLALVMAFAAGLGRMSRFVAVRALATTYIEFFRGTSIFVQLFWAYFVLPFAGITLTPLQAGFWRSASMSAPTVPRWCGAPCGRSVVSSTRPASRLISAATTGCVMSSCRRRCP